MSLSVELLEASLKQIKPYGDEFAATFYHKLFTIYPNIKPLFKGLDTQEQHKQLMLSLDLILYNIRRPQVLDYLLRELGMRYIRHGAKTEHYEQVAEALMQTFPQYLGPNWTPEVQECWLEAYQMVLAKMFRNYQKESLQLPDIRKTPEAQSQPNKNPIAPNMEKSDDYLAEPLAPKTDIPQEAPSPHILQEKVPLLNDAIIQLYDNKIEYQEQQEDRLVEKKLTPTFSKIALEYLTTEINIDSIWLLGAGWLIFIILLIFIMI